MNPSDQKQHVLVFGGTGGIGSALARRLVSLGFELTLAARDADRLKLLAAEINCDFCSLDVTDPGAVENCFTKALENKGRLNGVVNCVGSLLLKPAHLTTDAEWAQTLTVNLTSSFYIVRAAASRMMRSGGGSIVLMSSAVALRGMINHEAIAAAKSGLAGLAQSAAATYAKYNIRVNCVAPGLVRTPMTSSLTKNETILKSSVSLHPLGRIGEPEQVASALAWFLAPENDWVTGQVLAVDGGLSSVQPRT